MPGTPAPTVGRIVHYVSYGTPGGEYSSQCRAAVITEVGGWEEDPEEGFEWSDDRGQHRKLVQTYRPEQCALTVMNPTGLFLNPGINHDEDGKAGGTWHWPERTEG